jgi:hypothetical protein
MGMRWGRSFLCLSSSLPLTDSWCAMCMFILTVFTINLRQPSHHLTLQAWQIFSTRFILGTLPRDHSIPTGLGNDLASDYLTTATQANPRLPEYMRVHESAYYYDSGVRYTWPLYRPSHAIDGQKSIHAYSTYMHELHVMHACAVQAVPAFPLQHLLQGRALQPTPFPSSRTRAVD